MIQCEDIGVYQTPDWTRKEIDYVKNTIAKLYPLIEVRFDDSDTGIFIGQIDENDTERVKIEKEYIDSKGGSLDIPVKDSRFGGKVFRYDPKTEIFTQTKCKVYEGYRLIVGSCYLLKNHSNLIEATEHAMTAYNSMILTKHYGNLEVTFKANKEFGLM